MNTFAITISPPLYRLDSLKLHKIYTYDITKILNRFSKHYMLYPEFTHDARLHYHGIIRVDDKIKYYRTKHKLDRIGFTKLDPFKTFKDKLRYLIYSLKNYCEIKELFDPIIYKSLRRTKKSIIVQEKPKVNILQYCKRDI